MFSWTNNTGHVRDTEKLFSSDVTILSRATNLVFVVSFYNAWFACKLDFPVLNQTHLVHVTDDAIMKLCEYATKSFS